MTTGKTFKNVIAGMALVAACACAASVDVVVTNSYELTLGTGRTVSPATSWAATDVLPDVGTPIFRFDCTQTNGWGFKDGTLEVTNIPSLVGERSLSLARNGGNWASYALYPPVYVPAESTLDGQPMLDFGGRKSSRGLLFNPDPETATSTYPAGSNVLHHIGTIAAVYGSQEGGGWLLSGGYGDNMYANHHFNAGYHWHRGTSRRELVNTDENIWFSDAMLRNPGYSGAVEGFAWHDGWPTFAKNVGFSGGWEVLVFNPTNASAQATGIGFNDGRMKGRSGGQKIAEMIIYDKILTDAERGQVEAYLQAKWFGHTPRGWNGNAALALLRAHTNATIDTSVGIVTTVDTPPNETLAIGRLKGVRHNKSAFLKTGEGTLALGDASTYGGVVRVSGGSLTFGRRPLPTSLPTNAIIHLDASAGNAFALQEENGTNFVLRWKNLAPDPVVFGNPVLYARTTVMNNLAKTPFLLKDVFGPGRHVVDFGAFGKGASLSFATNETSATTVNLDGVVAVVAVVGALNGGGHLLGDVYGWGAGSSRCHFTRGAQSPWYGSGLARTSALTTAGPKLSVADGEAYLNGRRRDPSQGYLHPGYQVIAMRGPGSLVSRIGQTESSSYSGGLRLSEIAIYNRPLSDTELADAQAYLLAKWLGRDMPGYERVSAPEMPDVQTVEVQGPAEINVPSGTARIRSLDVLSAPLVKTGDGTLEVEELKVSAGNLVVQGGRIERVAAPDVSSDCELAAAPSLHLDAAATNRMDIVVRNGTNCVACWHDMDYRMLAFNTEVATRPWLDMENLQNGLPVMEFGPFAQSEGGRYLRLSEPLDNVRAAFVVWGGAGRGGFLLGSVGSDNSNMFDFHRGTDSSSATSFGPGSQLLYYNNTMADIVNGGIYVDGVKTNYHYVPKIDDFQLVETYPLSGAHVSALAIDRGWTTRAGGQKIAEIVLYERILTERERVATRNYLRKKWFGADPEPLPEAQAPASYDEDALSISVDGALSLDVEADRVARDVRGAGVLVKDGAATLRVGDLSGFTGTVDVVDGVFAVTGRTATAAGVLVEDGLVFHADGSYGVEAATNELGVVSVQKWTSRHDPSWAAVPPRAAPHYLGYGLNGMGVVDMAYGGVNNSVYEFLRFQKDGAYAHVGNIRSVFWVIGSQNGGGYLLGGGTNQYNSTTHWNFHRGLRGTDSLTDTYGCTNYLAGGATHPDVKNANWYKNGEKVDPATTELSGRWDQLSMVMTSDAKYADAEGFAFDGRSIATSPSMLHRSGGQRLAEVLIYDRCLSENERLANETYLCQKWGVGGMHASVTNLAAVRVAADAMFDLSGTNQYVAAISGDGLVRNGVLQTAGLDAGTDGVGTLAVNGDLALANGTTWRIDLNGNAADLTAVTGSCTFGSPLTVELHGVGTAANLARASYIVLTAGAYGSAASLTDAVFTGDTVPTALTPTLRVTSGGVRLSFCPHGTLMIFR